MRIVWPRSTIVATALALMLDRKIGDPPSSFHPVAYFGQLANWTERLLYKDSYFAGAVSTMVLVGFPLGLSITSSPYPVAASVLVQYFCISDRQLRDVVCEVVRSVELGDLKRARITVGKIVGRSTRDMSESEVLRAAFESLAENSSDGAVAPIFYGTLLGDAGAVIYRCVNTLDSMFGHRNKKYERFGYVSARFDDLVNLIPSRLTWLCVYLLSSRSTRRRIRKATAQARAHPSPNAGVVEAGFAGRFDVEVGGVNIYDGVAEERVRFGGDKTVTTEDLKQAIIFERRVVDLAFVLSSVVALTLRTLVKRRWL